nr:unnamed protein product [Callosobruchus analis]
MKTHGNRAGFQITQND